MLFAQLLKLEVSLWISWYGCHVITHQAYLLLDPIPLPISDNQYPALDRTRLVSSHRTSLNSPTFDHANSIQATLIINTHSALIADAIGLSITCILLNPTAGTGNQ